MTVKPLRKIQKCDKSNNIPNIQIELLKSKINSWTSEVMLKILRSIATFTKTNDINKELEKIEKVDSRHN